MKTTALWPLAARLSQLETQDLAKDSTRDRLLADKKAYQRDYMARDLADRDAEQLGQWWSQTADRHLQVALNASWRETKQASQFVPKERSESPPENAPENARESPPERALVPGLFILGLGKLGGEDLNFSSDVDLVAFYDTQSLPVPAFVGRTDITARVLRTFTQTLDGHKVGDFVWRTDWRLRPDPSVTDLSMSAEAAEDYHFYRAAPWRRLAMIKARVVAGDATAGQRFLDNLHPYLWRRHLDFSMIDEIAHLKQRIRREHPDLAEERRHETPLETNAGFHLKLGRGGIRDIEFFVNAQQLLWGGRHPKLQTGGTMKALAVLGEEGIVAPETALGLTEAYWMLRGLENRVQYWADGHTHFVPSAAEQQEWLADRSGFGTWSALDQALVETRRSVDDAVASLFASHGKAAKTVVPERAEGSEDALLTTSWQSWSQEADAGDVPAKIWSLAEAQGDLVHGVRLADDLFRRLGNRGQYLKLLSRDDKLFNAVIPPLFQAPAMTNLLNQSAHVVDGLLGRAGALPAAPELDQGRAMIAAAGDYEGKLEAARAWVNEQLYLAYLSVFSGQSSTQTAERHLTLLAEAALTLVAEMVIEDLGLAQFPLCILGLGKLGMQAMAPHSDLDLIFVVEEGWQLEEANAVAARFNTAFNAQMREGRVWEVDTRLRPSGRSGPPTITLSSFETHHLERAKTWEHIAQVPMRPLSGSPALKARVLDVKNRLVHRRRDEAQLTADAYRMLLRLRDQRIYDRPDDPGEVKLRPGGLMELEYLLAVSALRAGRDLPADLTGHAHDALAERLGQSEPALKHAADDLRRLRDWFFAARLYGPQWFERLEVEPAAITALTERVSESVRRLIDEPAQALGYDWVEYKEQSVVWSD